jgi:uncharacterized phage protein (TIGR01671 family)
MRQIKFRAWDGQTMHYDGIFQFTQFPQGMPVLKPQDTALHFPFEGIESGEMICGEAAPKVALMQFTGLYDKNGKEIWEGDIVNTWWNHHGKPGDRQFVSGIVFNEHISAWQISYRNIADGWASDNLTSRYFVEVIGNGYENPGIL